MDIDKRWIHVIVHSILANYHDVIASKTFINFLNFNNYMYVIRKNIIRIKVKFEFNVYPFQIIFELNW